MQDNQQENTPHQRRIRYKGTHPRTFSEKYKELAPDKYAATVAKIIQKGNTPAGMHISICVQEILDILNIRPGEKGLDATLGYGGHTQQMLAKLQGQGHLHALDADPIEIAKTRQRLLNLGYDQNIFTAHNLNFADIDLVAAEFGLFDFVLADLGVSSMQIDNPERGFTYKHEGPLDLRLNPQKGISAAERLLTISQKELMGMLIENADEPYAKEISQAIVRSIAQGALLETTTALRNVIVETLAQVPAPNKKELLKKTCQRVFQALRIDVNSEFEVLYNFLEKLPHILAPGGRVAILTFHSGEDRPVKKSFKLFAEQGLYSKIATEVIRPTTEECRLNPRAASAKLRWAIR